MMIGQDQERVVPHDLQNQLAKMVRNTQWSYAIFWTLSLTEARVLQWGGGYYNGDTKKMGKTSSKSHEINTNQMELLQRSEQLRQLYESLLESKPDEQKMNRTSAVTLSMEDLAHLEWYYLLCMSFTFKYTQSLPGRAYATGQHIWLCKAWTADSNVFTRSLLAKSASVQTVICFPHMGGVIELGSTYAIPEDLNLIRHIVKASQELTKPICPPIIDGKESFMLLVSRDDAESLDMEAVHNGISEFLDTETVDDVRISEAPVMHDYGNSKSMNAREMNDYPWKPQPYYLHKPDKVLPFYVPKEERELEQFMILRSMVPSVTKKPSHVSMKTQTDETSIISVESPDKLVELPNEMDFGMVIEGLSPTSELDKAIETDILQLLDHIEVSLVNNEVQVELSCPCRKYLLLDIMKVLHNFNLDTHTVQSSIYSGALVLSLKAKFVGAAFASEAMIKQALSRIINIF